jgi:hypothetical protein
MLAWALVLNLSRNSCCDIHIVRLLEGSAVYCNLGTGEDCWFTQYSDYFFGVLIDYPALFVVAKIVGTSPFQEYIIVLRSESFPGS